MVASGVGAEVHTYGDMDEHLAYIPLDEKILPNTAHCAFDHVGGVTQVWGKYLGELACLPVC